MNEITGQKAKGLRLANFMLYLYTLCIILCIILNFMQNFMHNFENFAGTGHRDRRLNRDVYARIGLCMRAFFT